MPEPLENQEQEAIVIPEAEQTVIADVQTTMIEAPTMNSLITGLHKLYEEAHSLITQYQKKLSDLTVKAAKVHGREAYLAMAEKSVALREDACQKVENVQALHQTVKDLHDSANLRLNAAAEAEKSLRQTTDLEHSKLTEERLVTQKEANLLEARRKNIDDEVKKRVQTILSSMGLKLPAEPEAVVAYAQPTVDPIKE